MKDFSSAWAGLEFAHPWLLLALAALPALAWWMGRNGPPPTIALPSLESLRGLGSPARRHSGRLRWGWPLAAAGLMILALARPRAPRGEQPDPSKGIDIMLALDFSRSMAEHDFHLEGKRISRRAALERVVEAFMDKRPHDRVGIVCFARSPFLVSPLTLDHKWSLESLKETDFATGTAIGEGMAASLEFLRHHSSRNKVVILVTDGQNMMGRPPLLIAQGYVPEKVRLYCILIGTEMVTPSAAANHELNKSSRLTGGQFFQANDTAALENVYQLIDQLEKRTLLQQRFVAWRELFPWPAGLALAFLLGEFVRKQWRRFP